MYSNLLDELNKKGISINAAAKIIDMPEATLRTKIQSRSFDVDEAFALRDNLFPEFDMRYLFKKDNTKSAWERSKIMTLKEFIETYEGFDWENGEVVLIDQRRGKNYICTCEDRRLKHPIHLDFEREYNLNVYSQTHTCKTMMIVI